MRYHPDDKQKTRQRIVKVAARRYRAEGLVSVGIANLMADLGMTHGGFYAHFTDKEALVASACQEAFATQLRNWDERLSRQAAGNGLEDLIRGYLSQQHREHPETGCFAAALAGEIARRDNRSRQAFTAGIKQLLDRLAQSRGNSASNIRPEAVLALMVGSMMLARAVSDPGLSDSMLSIAADTILGNPEA